MARPHRCDGPCEQGRSCGSVIVMRSYASHPCRSGPARRRWLVGLVPLLLLAGCVTVSPSQRQHLSAPEMNPAVDAQEEGFHTHIEAAREGAMGGHGSAGGGCGCG
jgi:hypothetical protein